MLSLDDILRFTNLLNNFRNIERMIVVNGKKRKENDVEHSYQLALLGWYMAESCNADLKKDLIIKYALIHDLVEVYAGDTDPFSSDDEHISSKESREHKAAEQLRKEFPNFPEMNDLIDQYERREDPESKFIYALDKVQPMLNVYLSDDKAFRSHDRHITIDMIIEKKKDKVSVSPEIECYFNELVCLMRERLKPAR